MTKLLPANLIGCLSKKNRSATTTRSISPYPFTCTSPPVRMRHLVEQASAQPVVVPWDVWDAFILWCPLGLFGAHWFYLGHPKRGLSYTCTLGYCLIGWLVDASRIKAHVASLNRRTLLSGIMLAEEHDSLQV